VLEVGIGTGISLPLYGPNVRIFGTDISEAMLKKGQAARRELRLKNVEGLRRWTPKSSNSRTIRSTS